MHTQRLEDQAMIMDAILVTKQELERVMKTGTVMEQGAASVRLSNLYALLDISRLREMVGPVKRIRPKKTVTEILPRGRNAIA